MPWRAFTWYARRMSAASSPAIAIATCESFGRVVAAVVANSEDLEMVGRNYTRRWCILLGAAVLIVAAFAALSRMLDVAGWRMLWSIGGSLAVGAFALVAEWATSVSWSGL